MSYKQAQKELKKPDELQKLGQQALPWMETHGRMVVGIVLGLAGLGLVATLINSYIKRGEEQAAHEFGAALRVLEREVKADPGEPRPGEEPPFKTEAEKDAAVITALTEFRKKNAGSLAATNAALPLAQALIRQGKAAEAMPLLDEYLKNADPADPLRAAAYEARGYVLESEKKYDEAIAAFDALAKENKTDFMKGMGLYHRARILLLKGDTAGGAKQLSEIEAVAPGSAAARLAKERIALLTSQGVAVPAAPPPGIALDAGT
ncbi:MAG: tetratricopeptide repeat protein [Myxococcota bacterium]|jgi:tetratricopeptide (TPR) repeat protein